MLFFLCHNLRLHKLKNRGTAYVKRSSFCFTCSISMPYLLIKTPSPLWDQEILTYIRKCLGYVPAWAVVYKCPVCVDLLLVGRRSERLCRRLVWNMVLRYGSHSAFIVPKLTEDLITGELQKKWHEIICQTIILMLFFPAVYSYIAFGVSRKIAASNSILSFTMQTM